MTIDSRFRVEVISQMLNPQQIAWKAMHQDYSENFVFDEDCPSEEKCGESIVKHCLAGGRGHWGITEHPQIVFNCGWFPHSVIQQVRTHRNVSFDVQCLSGDTEVTFVNCEGTTSKELRKTMEELYELWHNGEKAERNEAFGVETDYTFRRSCQTRIKKMRVRSLNEETNTFTSNHIEDVVFNGLNPTYKVTLADGKEIKCTQNHKILTPYGWRILAQLSVESDVMVNGQALVEADKTYQDKDWLIQHFDQGLIPREVAAIAGCSTESIKKWAYHHKLTWQKKQWNKGIKYSIDISPEERERRRNHGRRVTAKRVADGTMPSGSDHPSWNPNIPLDKKVYGWMKSNRKRLIEEKGGACIECGEQERLHIHHIKEVSKYPELAYDETNLTLLCASCHIKHHSTGRHNPLCAHPIKIISIEYVGVEATYDLVMKAPHHNFVANGIVVHNSMRYSGSRISDVVEGKRELEDVFYLRPTGNYTDRQGKRYEYTAEQREEDLAECLRSAKHYALRVMKQGFSEEHARGTISFDFRQHFVLSGNARSMFHLMDLRAKADAQLECQQLCELIYPHLERWVPEIADYYLKNRYGKARLAP